MPTITKIPGKSENDDMMIRFHHCLNMMMEKHRDLLTEESEQEFEDAVLQSLAKGCCEMGLPVEFAMRRARYCGELHHDWDTITTVFNSVYMAKHIKQKPLKYMPKSAILAYRTEAYMKEHYELRKDVMTGAVEYKQLGLMFSFSPLTEEVRNTMTVNALKAGIDSWDRDIRRYIESDLIQTYDPIFEYLSNLPKWDGKDRITPLARRVKTDAPHWEKSFRMWMLSMVAQWRGSNTKHGNAIVPLLIGRQGSGKTTFCRRLLPEALQGYFNDRLPMKNDTDIYNGMSSYALINLDEFVITDAQQPILKYLLSKHDVKMRKPYGRVEEQRKRYASFIATTNNEHPLIDPTGSRRFVCVKADMIDNKGTINHDQIFAQVLCALNSRERYWFTDKETQQLMEYNARFQKARDLATMVTMLFLKSEDTPSDAPWLSIEEIMHSIRQAFPKMEVTDSVKIRMGRTLTELGYERKRTNAGQRYRIKISQQKLQTTLHSSLKR